MHFDNYPQFFTATILEWKPLLQNDGYKKIVVDSMRFLVSDKRVVILSFVIMPNHIHVIWQVSDGYKPEQVQQSFLKYTAQQIKFDLQKNDPELLQQFMVDAADREYQFWERNAHSINLFTDKVFEQKFNYIHDNPIQEKWRLAVNPEDYRWSTARFYAGGENEFEFVTHCDGE